MPQSGCAERITCHLRSKTSLELILAAPSSPSQDGGGGKRCDVAANGGGSLALPSLPGGLAPAQTDTAKRCSDGCLNRLIGLVTGGTATDGGNEHAGRKTREERRSPGDGADDDEGRGTTRRPRRPEGTGVNLPTGVQGSSTALLLRHHRPSRGRCSAYDTHRNANDFPTVFSF